MNGKVARKIYENDLCGAHNQWQRDKSKMLHINKDKNR